MAHRREDARRRRDYFQALLGALETLGLEVGQLAAGGDVVYATTQQRYRVRATGEIFAMRDSVHRFTIRGGRFVGWMATEDTARVREVLTR